jgi:hypothetical protein
MGGSIQVLQEVPGVIGSAKDLAATHLRPPLGQVVRKVSWRETNSLWRIHILKDLDNKIMCTWIIEKAEMEGSAKGADGWFKLAQANVYYDHPYDAPMDHALVIDFVEDPGKPEGRVAVEMSAVSAGRLISSIKMALETGEREHGLR